MKNVQKIITVVTVFAMLIFLLNGNFEAFVANNAFISYLIALVAGLQMGAVTYGVDLITVYKNHKEEGVASFYKWSFAWVAAFIAIVAVYRWEL